MKALPYGTQVKVIKKGDSAAYHGYDVGSIATSMGELFEGNTIWQRFKDEDGFTQFLQDQHFELVEVKASAQDEHRYRYRVVSEVPVVKDTDELLDKEVDIDLPSKVVYAITNKNNEIVSCKVDRDKARETKALLGGKKKGVRIFQYVATKEIR